MTLRAFPPCFLVGFATSAHQVEGAGTEGGSLVDKFERQFGCSKRFGVAWVGWSTQRRTPKDCAILVRDVYPAGAAGDGAAPR